MDNIDNIDLEKILQNIEEERIRILMNMLDEEEDYEKAKILEDEIWLAQQA
tara:strand:- start:1581 stop:1733 length:153 start_codon:yes stop_codon:yes gene_type:complete